ncbi:MAG TPA: hypothetical protein VEL28_04405 [Candidatus Binatia bacterium]|nr:hypothetical protein [Candidatus Binatia bacterium]
MKIIRTVIASASLVLLPATAVAGVLDSPLPLLQGQKSNHIYSVSGVVSAAGLGTFFSCTNPSTLSVLVSVELFTEGGGDACNDASSVSVSIAPGETVLFSTQNKVQSSFFSTQPLTAVDMFLSLGSARIVSTGKALLCSAFVADVYNSPPMSMTQLNLMAKGKQRGD